MSWKEEFIELTKTTPVQEMNTAKSDVNSLVQKYPELKDSENIKMMLYVRLKFGIQSLMDVKHRVYDADGESDDEEDSVLAGLFESNIESSPQDNLMFFKSSLTSIIQNEERLKVHYVLSQDNPRVVNSVTSGQTSVKSVHFWVEKEIRDVTLWGEAIERFTFETGKAYKMVTTPARDGGWFIDTTIPPVVVTSTPPELETLVNYIVKSVPEAQPPFGMLSNIKSYHIVGQLLDIGGQFSILNKYTKNMNGMLILFNSQRLPVKSGMKFVAIGKFSKKRNAEDVYFFPDVLVSSSGLVEPGTFSNTTNTTTQTSGESKTDKNDYGE